MYGCVQYCIPALLHTANVTEWCQCYRVRYDDYLANSTYLKSGTITSEINPFEHGVHLQVSLSRRQVVGQSERSKAQWTAEKKAGKDRGKAISAALRTPEYKAKLALRDPEVETRRRKAIKETYELKEAAGAPGHSRPPARGTGHSISIALLGHNGHAGRANERTSSSTMMSPDTPFRLCLTHGSTP